METVVRIFLMISVSVACVVGARLLYLNVESFSYEAFLEVPVFVSLPERKEAAEMATSSATSTSD